MTCRTFRCRQVSTWLGSGCSGTSATTRGTEPLGLRPGLPLGLPPCAVLVRFPAERRTCRLPRCGPCAHLRIVCLISVPTLALAALDIKHLFDAPQKMSDPSGTTESHERSIGL